MGTLKERTIRFQQSIHAVEHISLVQQSIHEDTSTPSQAVNALNYIMMFVLTLRVFALS